MGTTGKTDIGNNRILNLHTMSPVAHHRRNRDRIAHHPAQQIQIVTRLIHQHPAACMLPGTPPYIPVVIHLWPRLNPHPQHPVNLLPAPPHQSAASARTIAGKRAIIVSLPPASNPAPAPPQSSYPPQKPYSQSASPQKYATPPPNNPNPIGAWRWCGVAITTASRSSASIISR